MQKLQDRITEQQIKNIILMRKSKCTHADIASCVGLSATTVSRILYSVQQAKENLAEGMAYAKTYNLTKPVHKALIMENIIPATTELPQEETRSQQMDISTPKFNSTGNLVNTAYSMTRIIGELYQLNKKIDTLLSLLKMGGAEWIVIIN